MKKDISYKWYFSVLLLMVLISSYAIIHIFMYPDHSVTPLMASKETDDLLYEINERADDYYEEAEDAYIDDVWKKTPGRNGRKVNVKKSYDKMKEKGTFDASLLVFDEIRPSITLKDLPAAPIYRGHPEKDAVAFLINVSWGTEYIPEILKVLRKQNVKATFFIEGKWAKENKNLVKMIHEQEHIIGNHAYNHPDMARMSQVEIREQIVQTNDILEAIIGTRPKWFAPPSGSFNDQVVKITHEINMETILWTVDTIDWQNPSVSVMINRVITNIHPGATVLMHPTDSVAQGLTNLIEEIRQKDLEITTIENVLSEKR